MSWRALEAGPLNARAGIPGIGPMLVWADATGGLEHRPPDAAAPHRLTVLAEEARGSVAVQRIEPAALSALLAGMAGGDAGALRRIELQQPAVPQRPRPRVVTTVQPLKGKRARSRSAVLVGVIDSGCPFAHRMLRTAEVGTRVLHFWDQDPDNPDGARVAGAGRRSDLSTGCEMDRKTLEALMRRHHRSASGIDEAACYAEAGARNLQTAFSHGAAVLGRLFGSSPQVAGSIPAVAADADLVFVQLPRDAVQDSSSAALAACLVEGIRYIVGCAGPDTRRVVINISDGSSRTTHDGCSMIERALTGFAQGSKKPEVHVVLPAGNSNDEERHAVLSNGQSAWLRVDPDTEATSFVVFRVPAGAGARLRVVPPGASDGADSNWVAVGQALGWSASKAGAAGKLAAGLIVAAPAKGEAHAEGLLVIAPTLTEPGTRVPAPAGLWRIEVQSDEGPQGRVDAWVSRNGTNAGALVRGHQARFVDHDGSYDPNRLLRPRDDDPVIGAGSGPAQASVIRRDGSLNGLAGAPAPGRIWVATASYQVSGELTRYSSRSDPALSQPAPQAWASLDRARTLPGVLTSGNFSAAWSRVTGTSFAAPALARYLASLPADEPVPLVAQLPESAVYARKPTSQQSGDALLWSRAATLSAARTAA